MQKKFNTKYTLIRHKKSCHENIENKGDQCEEREESPEVPNQHKKSVHEIKQYQCDQCEFKETTKLNLRRHTESEHKDIKITKYILKHIVRKGSTRKKPLKDRNIFQDKIIPYVKKIQRKLED